jgi:predicted outer membrane repeat protein
MKKNYIAILAGVILLSTIAGCGSVPGPSGTVAEAERQTMWYVAGKGAPLAGSDSNPGTESMPLASVQKALELIHQAYTAKAPWIGEGEAGSALIIISGTVKEYGSRDKADDEVMGIRGMIEIAGEGKYPPIILAGVPGAEHISVLDAGKENRVIYLANGNNLTIAADLCLTGGMARSGGAVYAQDSTLLVCGTIIENTAEDGAGILMVDGFLHLTDKAVISQNNATIDNGGGLYVINSEFRMDGEAKIQDNTGGGAIFQGTTAYIGESAKISGNLAEYDGGGIVLWKNAPLRLEGSAWIDGNTAKRSGGGIYATKSELLIGANVLVSQNYCTVDGGAVYIGDGKLTVRGNAHLLNNEAWDDGGGIHAVYSEVVLMEQCQVEENSAGCGAGICIDLSSKLFVFDNAVITGNFATGAEGIGGGLCAGVNSTITMAGGTVTGNTALLGGGVYIRDGEFTFNSGTISGNRAKEGGGIYVLRGDYSQSGGELLNNTPEDLWQQ